MQRNGSAQSNPIYRVVHDVDLPEGGRLIGKWLTPPLRSRFQLRKALKRINQTNSAAYGTKGIIFY